MTRGRPALWTAAMAVVLAAGLTGWGCGEKQEPAKRVTYVPPRSVNRPLNPIELDSLIQMKVAYNVTRDEYWDGYGGVLANDALEVWYPTGRVNAFQGISVLKLMELARRNTEKLFGRAPTTRLVVVCSGNLEVFRAATGREWWNYSLIKGDTLNLQSPMDLFARGLLTVAAPHEYYKWAIDHLSNHRAPRWLDEGLASLLAQEAAVLETHTSEFGDQGMTMSFHDMESALRSEQDRITTRRAYYNAYRMVEKLALTRGQPAVVAFVLDCGDEKDLNAASTHAFGVGYDAIVEEARSWAAVETQ
jgi:hypothetical protein